MRDYYKGFAQMLVELLKGATLSAEQITRRVKIHNLDKVQDYLAKGQSFGGQYRLKNATGYPSIRGIMTWSINWDAYSGFAFSSPHRSFLNSL